MAPPASIGRDPALLQRLCTGLQAQSAEPAGRIQSLWSGYGEILRVNLQGADARSVIVKRVAPPVQDDHPRGWNTDLSHQRKLRSYEIEGAFYQGYAGRCGVDCRIPRLRDRFALDGAQYCVLEDLDAAGFSARRSAASRRENELCLAWLACFHAEFLGEAPDQLWPVGTYWHLTTRPDELAAMQDTRLREAAPAIDAKLTGARYQTFVHGDAKLANFCFAPDASAVAAVDFQYVGGGAGIKDVIYYLSSSLDGEESARDAESYLQFYFQQLRNALGRRHPDVDASAVEAEWHALYPVAWADFVRFLRGWSPDHWKLHDYSEQLTRRVLDQL